MEIIERKLKDIGKYINGKAFKPEDWQNAGTPIIRIENLNNENARFNYYQGECEEKYHIKKGDILLSWSATLDAFIWDKENAFLNQHIFKVVPDLNILNFSFAFYIMKYAITTMGMEAHGSTMVHITKPKFDNFKVKFPKSKSDQVRLAEYLNSKLASVEQMRQAALQQKEAVEALQGALLREVFPYKEGDELPKGWKWIKIKDVTHFKNGINYSESDIIEGVKIVGVSCFKKHFYVKEELLDEISSDIVRENDFLQDGDLIVVRSNGNPELVGRHIIFRGNNKITNSGFTIRMRLNIDELYPEFYLLYGKSTPFREQIKGQGSNISNLSQDKLKKVVLPAPKSTKEQKELTDKFLIKLEKLEELKYHILTQLEAIETLPAAILREVFEFKTK